MMLEPVDIARTRFSAAVHGLLALSLVSLVSVSAACDRQDGASKAGPCPPCECVCDCSDPETVAATDDPASTDVGGRATTDAARTELSELVVAANRKMMHGDGAGCIADLDKVKQLDPTLEAQLTITRGQCEMANGDCQKGKQRVVEWYMREQAFTREFAERTTESIASMRCRGGDASDRDRLLAALFDLSDGAYMNKRDSQFCRDRVQIVEDLAPKVKPRDAEDTQVSGGLQALFHTSAMCFARAEDCSTAYAYYRRLFPREALDAMQDAKMRETMVRDSFDSTIVLCKKP
jgi:hypothetical protein